MANDALSFRLILRTGALSFEAEAPDASAHLESFGGTGTGTGGFTEDT